MKQDNKLGTEIYNFFKYLSSFLVTVFSFLYYQHECNTFLYLWLFFAILSTIYSYIWDLKMDWGLLDRSQQKNYLLRKELSYNNKTFYYSAMLMNLVLRMSWVFSISPGIVDELKVQKEMFSLIISFLEMFRRCVWNFFRVEKEHIKNQQLFQAV